MSPRHASLRLAILVGGALLAAGVGAHASAKAHPHPAPGLFTIHIEYGAQEDLIACPGTPYRVVTYTSLPHGAADVQCRKADLP